MQSPERSSSSIELPVGDAGLRPDGGARRIGDVDGDAIEALAEDERVVGGDERRPREPRGHDANAQPPARAPRAPPRRAPSTSRGAHTNCARHEASLAQLTQGTCLSHAQHLALVLVELRLEPRAPAGVKEADEPEVEGTPEHGVGGVDRLVEGAIALQELGVLVMIDVRVERGDPHRDEHRAAARRPRRASRGPAPRERTGGPPTPS